MNRKFQNENRSNSNMGEDDKIVVDKRCCSYARGRQDCDGDWDTYCTKYGNCQYQHNVRDCDGDIISLCRR